MWLRVPDGVDDVTAAAAYDGLLRQVAAGDIRLDIDPVPLAQVEQAWPRAGSHRRVGVRSLTG